MSSKQYGFISGRSTTTQLLRYLDNCIETIVDGGVVYTIYLDFAEAFDTVAHRRLIVKLESYGLNGNILNWIKGFLSGRSQFVKVNGADSKSIHVLSGVPQGSALRPFLFVIYINDLPEAITTDALLFPDDTKLFRQITSREDTRILQCDIDSLRDWSEKWLLMFNLDKCHVLTFKFENIMYIHRYDMYRAELKVKDLGVTIDAELRFEGHISA